MPSARTRRPQDRFQVPAHLVEHAVRKLKSLE